MFFRLYRMEGQVTKDKVGTSDNYRRLSLRESAHIRGAKGDYGTVI